MKIAFPVKENIGLDSIIDENFGRAQNFLIADSKTRNFELMANQKIAAQGSTCKTGVFKKDAQVDAVVTRCMGDGAKKNLTSSNIMVYQAQKESILDNLELFENNKLKLFHMFDHCQTKKNKKEGGCGHHH
ncbi:MAG: dinitrogenase iron-molybdenum cofactor [Deltaproteobacteria bacterium]|jgi:predicted Fe-Mo cluster-binding NifX family protein|nr:dinitrogenase iron-molybdenum cofactor [Deltaproteobacteria bacterium]